MIASLKPVLDILGAPDAQYLIPVFQRVYSWSRLQCDQLWEDVLAAGEEHRMHFMGTVISRPVREGTQGSDGAAGGLRRVSLVDGQQRLVTVALLLVALRDEQRNAGEGLQARELDERYLHAASGAIKLGLAEADAPTLALLVDGTPLPEGVEPSRFLMENRMLFREKVASSRLEASAVMAGLKELAVVSMELEDADSPQQAFESLNAKGRPLSTADLLRNVLLATYGLKEQERLFDLYWTPIDEAFRRFGPEQDIYLDAALHCWASKAAPELRAAKRSDLYQAFKVYLAQRGSYPLEELLASLSAECLAFDANPASAEARAHLDWVVDKPQGLVSERRLFGD